jgi:hypothetical protein
MIDPISLGDLALRAADWANKVAAERRSKGDKRAANLIRDAGILTAAVQVLINDTYSLIGALGRFDDDWTGEQREDLYDRVSAYMVRHSTIPFIHRSVAALEAWSPDELDRVASPAARAAVDELVRWGTVVAERDEYNKMSYFVLGDLPWFWSKLKEARSLEDLGWLAAWARSFDAPVPGGTGQHTPADRLRSINEAFGRLSTIVLHEHPGVPPPAWTQHVITGDVVK